ncbi:MAG: polysaccharide biosynthesis tyrosine autokinase [Actinomycetota bacterium]|nr:polysaccharide biosynthesis tyrosine autokinase [Actinomycetota bacterium]
MQESFQVLVACSANVCRSPLAASIIRAEVGELGSAVYVNWAGTYAAVGDAMCSQAAAYLGHVGAVGSSRQITAPLLMSADLLLTADRSQRAWLARMNPASRPRTFTLRQGARLASGVTQQLAAGFLPLGSPPLPENLHDRLMWLVSEMDAARGSHAFWDPHADDIEDLHSEDDHRATLDEVAQASTELARAFMFVATVDPASVDSTHGSTATEEQQTWESPGVDLARKTWISRLFGRRPLRTSQELQEWVPGEHLGEISSSTPTYSHILLTPHSEIEQHLQRALAHADLHSSKSFPAIVLVTSAREGAGKTAAAISLATGFAQAGRSVVLVDADLRESKVSSYLGLEPEVGLPDVIAGMVPVAEALMTWRRGLLQVLTCGPRTPEPGALLESTRFRTLMAELRNEFEMVIVNAPPVCEWSDAIQLASVSDGTVLVAARGRTRRKDAMQAAADLRVSKANLLGTIMTVAPASH